MAMVQAVRAFELFNGVAPDSQRLVEHFSEFIRLTTGRLNFHKTYLHEPYNYLLEK